LTTLEIGLIDRVLHGDVEAFHDLVETYKNPVYHLCYRMLGNAEDAEDATQETFWKAYKAIHKFDLERSFATWLLSIAAHHCIDQMRKRYVSSFSLELLPEGSASDDSPSPEDEVARSETGRQVQELLNELKPEDRAVIILRYWYEMSEQEISDALSMTVSAVKSRLHRARRSMARAWVTMQPAINQAGGFQREAPTF
jgi:RNA polymerase sigma-70 factor (ECF subfamily)